VARAASLPPAPRRAPKSRRRRGRPGRRSLCPIVGKLLRAGRPGNLRRTRGDPPAGNQHRRPAFLRFSSGPFRHFSDLFGLFRTFPGISDAFRAIGTAREPLDPPTGARLRKRARARAPVAAGQTPTPFSRPDLQRPLQVANRQNKHGDRGRVDLAAAVRSTCTRRPRPPRAGEHLPAGNQPRRRFPSRALLCLAQLSSALLCSPVLC